jgi:hypothetical protein
MGDETSALSVQVGVGAGAISVVEAHNRIGFLEFWRESLTHVVH